MKIRKFPFHLNFDFTTLVKQNPNILKTNQFFGTKLQNFEEATKKLNQILLETKEIQDNSTITSILDDLKYIKLQSKSYDYHQKKIISNFQKEIIENLNSKLIDGFQEAGLKQYINPDKKPDFHTNYLRQLSLLDRLEFIKFVKKIDNDLELHNTNNLNKFTVVSFEENIKMNKKKIRTYLPYYLFILFIGTTLYWIWAFYYCFEYDVWMWDPRVTDWHVYRFS